MKFLHNEQWLLRNLQGWIAGYDVAEKELQLSQRGINSVVGICSGNEPVGGSEDG
jgi:hypothetical protein